MKYNKFDGRFTKVVKCEGCGKSTLSGIDGNIGLSLCRKCFDEAGYENEHNDGYHRETKVSNCPLCKG